MSTLTVARLRPNLMIFAARRSSSLILLPYNVPAGIRLTVTLGALPDRLRPSDGATTAFATVKFAARSPAPTGVPVPTPTDSPGLLMKVAPTWTSAFGIRYEASDFKLGSQGVSRWQYGFNGAVSGSCALISQLSLIPRPPLTPPSIVRF